MFLDRGFLCIGNVSKPFNQTNTNFVLVLASIRNGSRLFHRPQINSRILHEKIQTHGFSKLFRRFLPNHTRLVHAHNNWLLTPNVRNVEDFRFIHPTNLLLYANDANNWTICQKLTLAPLISRVYPKRKQEERTLEQWFGRN